MTADRARPGAVPAPGRLAPLLALGLAAGLAAAGCSSSPPSGAPSPSSAPGPAGTATPVSQGRRHQLARQYLAIARPANRRLDHEVDGFEDEQHDNVRRAVAELRAQVATERKFDRQLAGIGFPLPIRALAHLLIEANQDRITLTLRQARATTPAGLAAFRKRHAAADAAVEKQVRALRRALGLPPPGTD